jgi:thiol-disulfide isomerase/thioredoxin
MQLHRNDQSKILMLALSFSLLAIYTRSQNIVLYVENDYKRSQFTINDAQLINHKIEYEKPTKDTITINANNNLSNASIIQDQNFATHQIDSMINDNKNKIIIIDLWASWCSPCIAEIPKIRTLKNKYRDQIIILPIKIDKFTDAWYAAIKRYYSFEENHYMLTTPDLRIMSKTFKIIGIPFYIVIDKTGNIFSGDKIKPSEKNFSKLLDKLVKK